MKVKHLHDEKTPSKFLKYIEFQTKYTLETPYLPYVGLISYLLHLRREIYLKQEIGKEEIKSIVENTFAGLASTKIFYKAFKKQITTPRTSQSKWERDCGGELNNREEIKWEKIHCESFAYSKSTKLRNFQFKFLHKIIPTNTFLYKIGIKDAGICSFCRKDSEIQLHLFWTCETTTISGCQ